MILAELTAEEIATFEEVVNEKTGHILPRFLRAVQVGGHRRSLPGTLVDPAAAGPSEPRAVEESAESLVPHGSTKMDILISIVLGIHRRNNHVRRDLNLPDEVFFSERLVDNSIVKVPYRRDHLISYIVCCLFL